jgi:hypothetical protein
MLTGLWTSWKATFDECINNEVKLREDYWRRSWEIYDRETRVVRELTNSKTIVELRTRLEKPYYSSSKHKDKSLEELLFDLKENQQKVTITEGNENYGKPLKQLQDQLRAFPRCWKLQEMFYEKVNETFKDEDLNDVYQSKN